MLNKFTLALFVGLLLTSMAFSQTLMVEKAYQHLKKNELVKGFEAIELASQNEYTANDPKTWYLKAFICKELYKSQPQLDSNYRQQALEAIQKCIVLDSSQTFVKDCEAIAAYIHTSYINEAVQLLNAGKFEEAIPIFQMFTEDKKQAYYAEALYYSGYASLMLKRYAQANAFFEKALAAGYQDPLAYETIVNHYLEQQNFDVASALLKEGKSFFPDSKELRIVELNLLMAQQNYEQAENSADAYLAIYPHDIEVMLLAGTIYDKLFQNDTAQTGNYFQKRKNIYQKILVQAPDNLMANYNMGITLYNQAVKMINQQAETYEIDIMEFNRLLEQCTDLFKEALPYIQKANQLMPDNVNTLKAMKGIYYNLNDREKFNQVQAKLETLKSN